MTGIYRRPASCLAIMQKLGARSRIDAIRVAEEKGWL
jgi:DNA-binding NarL/FixJ family response regulator